MIASVFLLTGQNQTITAGLGTFDVALDELAAVAGVNLMAIPVVAISALFARGYVRGLTASMVEGPRRADKGPSASLAPSSAVPRNARDNRADELSSAGPRHGPALPVREYASRAAFGRRLAAGPLLAARPSFPSPTSSNAARCWLFRFERRPLPALERNRSTILPVWLVLEERRRAARRGQLRGGARRPGARRSRSTLSARTSAPTKQMASSSAPGGRQRSRWALIGPQLRCG